MSTDFMDDHNEGLNEAAVPLANWAARLRILVEDFEAKVRQLDDPVAFAVRDSEPVALRKLKLMVAACWDCIRELDGTVERVGVIKNKLEQQFRAIDELPMTNGESEFPVDPDTGAQDEPRCTHQAPDSIN